MSDDLVEKIAKAIMQSVMMTRAEAKDAARAAIAAIEASGTHVVAPVEQTEEMDEAGFNADVNGQALWAAFLSARPKVLP